MASYLQSINLPGSGAWMRMLAQEEHQHAMKIIDYVEHRLGRVFLSSIDGPTTEWTSVLDVFEDAFKNEQDVTKMILYLVLPCPASRASSSTSGINLTVTFV